MHAPPVPQCPPPGVGANPDKAAELARDHSALAVALLSLRDDASCDCVTPHAGGTLALAAGQATAIAVIDAARAKLGDASKWHGQREGYVEWKHFRRVLKQIGTLSRDNVLQLKPALVGAVPAEDLTVFPVKQELSPVRRAHTDLNLATERILSRAEAAAHAAQPARCYICLSVDCEEHPEEPLLSTGCACCREGSSLGRAHVSCLAGAAAHQPMLWHQKKLWNECPTCKQLFTGTVHLELCRTRWELCRNRPEADAERVHALHFLAFALSNSGDHATARPLLEELEAVGRRIGNKDFHQNIARLCTLLSRMDDEAGAKPSPEETLAGLRLAVRDEDEAMLDTVSGVVHGKLGATAKARFTSEEAVMTCRRTRPTHPSTFFAISNLAVLITNIGDSITGRALREEVAASTRRELGPAHPMTQQLARWHVGTSDERFPPGTRATGQLFGLAAKPELNGKQAAVVGFDTAKGRYHVRHEGNWWTGRPIGIKPANLILRQGSAVIVEGLDTAPEWNGKRGLVESYDAAKGRYRLLVKERTKALGVRVACCKLQFAVEQEQQEHEKTRRAQIEASVKAAIALREPEPEPEQEPEP
eukprot:COSAG06_NODE_9209_length_1958_cov_1.408822_1_plen_590_part_10